MPCLLSDFYAERSMFNMAVHALTRQNHPPGNKDNRQHAIAFAAFMRPTAVLLPGKHSAVATCPPFININFFHRLPT